MTIGLYDTNSAPTSSSTLYLWSDDETAVSLAQANKLDGTMKVQKLTLRIPHATGPGYTTEDRWVCSFPLVTGKKTYSFALQGVTEGKTANIILSGSNDYLYDSTEMVVTNFLVSPLAVKCGKKPAPRLTVTCPSCPHACILPGVSDL